MERGDAADECAAEAARVRRWRMQFGSPVSDSAEYWFPHLGLHEIAAPKELLVIATDGSYDPLDHWGAVAVSASGGISLTTGANDGSFQNTAELEAVMLAVAMIEQFEPARAIVLIDSADALVEAFSALGKYPPDSNHGIDPRVRYRLEASLFGMASHVEFHKVKAHSGNLLNAAADNIAWASRRSIRTVRRHTEPALATHMDFVSKDIQRLWRRHRGRQLAALPAKSPAQGRA